MPRKKLLIKAVLEAFLLASLADLYSVGLLLVSVLASEGYVSEGCVEAGVGSWTVRCCCLLGIAYSPVGIEVEGNIMLVEGIVRLGI